MQIPVSHGSLEAALREPEGSPVGAAVLCHPHPLHGGTMHTKAVFRAAQALNDAGLLVLRFNFRGVGTSTGSYEEGAGEEEDVEAAIRFVRAEHPDLPLVVGGFSFGSLVGTRVGARDERVRALIAIGIPVRLYDFSHLAEVDRPVLVVQGEEDEFGPGAEAEELGRRLGPHVTVERIPKSDHYFEGRFDELREAIRRFFAEGPGARALATRNASPEGEDDA